MININNHHKGCKLQVNLTEYKAIGVLCAIHNCFTKYQRVTKKVSFDIELSKNCLTQLVASLL